MSCEIKPLAKLLDLRRVQELFGLGQGSYHKGNVIIISYLSNQLNCLFSDDDWLNLVYYSISPTLEVIAFGHGTKVILLGQNWNNEVHLHCYTITWTGELENPNDVITSVICLPVAGQSLHTQSVADWTAIVIGLSSGTVLFYTDSGIQIYAQQWHNESIVSLKAQSGKSIVEELFISYQSCVCVISGVNLFQTLKMMRQQFLKSVNLNKFDLSPTQETIACRKWGYGGKNVAINDTVVVGSQKSSGFDHLLTATLEGGFFAKYRSSPPQNSLVLAAGSKPYIGFHYAKEGFVQPMMADVARAVATKIKSALPSWFPGSQQQIAEAAPPPVPSEPMVCRFGLCDHQRSAMSVYLAPDGLLAAVTDNLGRVILVDCNRAIALRVWKGYREAQCSFIEVVEKNPVHPTTTTTTSKKRDRRRAIFLVIFAPRRSVLEIWPLQRGTKTAAFTANRLGQLLHITHGMMGAAPGTKIKYNHQSCLFIDPVDQTLKDIKIPFHCAISDANSKTAKDLHLLRRIKMCLKLGEDDGTEEQIRAEIELLCTNLQTNEIRLLCLEMMVKNQKISPIWLRQAIESIGKQIISDDEETGVVSSPAIPFGIDEDSNQSGFDKSLEPTPEDHRQQIQILSTNYTKLVDFYSYVMELNDIHDEPATSSSSFGKLSVSSSELDSIQRLLDLLSVGQTTNVVQPKVKFQDIQTKTNNFIVFLNVFNCQSAESIVMRDDKPSSYGHIGGLIFSRFLESGKSLDNFVLQAHQSGIQCEDFIRVLLHYWLEKPFEYTQNDRLIMDMTRFSEILQNICILACNKVKFGYNSISLWWQTVREMLLESSCALRGLLAAMICRTQALRCSQKEIGDDANSDDEKFEELSQEACEWSLLIGKLDDIAVLGAILSVAQKVADPVLPTLKYEKPEISLKCVVKGGKGIVSELVTKWIAASGIDPIRLLETKSSPPKVVDGEDVDEPMDVDYTIETEPLLIHLNILREHFPFSLRSGVLLSQLTWEFMCYWSKNLSNFNYLSAGLKYLGSIRREDNAMRHGICCMLWNAHLKIPLEATKKIVNKVGRLPKEKLCLQDIGISDSLVPEFLENCLAFLDQFLDSLDHEKCQLNYEELLQDGPIPLVDLSLQQNLANIQLLRLHRELTMVLHLISFFNIKATKPKNLFNATANQSFFAEINRQLPYELPKPDLILQNFRVKFLCQIITASIDFIREDMEKCFVEEHEMWLGKCEKLAGYWDLNWMELKQHQVSSIFIFYLLKFSKKYRLLYDDVSDST